MFRWHTRLSQGVMMVSVDAVADYVLSKIDMDEGDSITNLKLQKIVYYCQAWHMALYGAPLFDERVEAWTHGPAVRCLYRRFRDFGYQAIDTSQLLTDPMTALDDHARSHIDEVWDAYGHLSGSQLRELSHQEDPWIRARGDVPPGSPCETEISLEDMQAYYASLIQ